MKHLLTLIVISIVTFTGCDSFGMSYDEHFDRENMFSIKYPAGWERGANNAVNGNENTVRFSAPRLKTSNNHPQGESKYCEYEAYVQQIEIRRSNAIYKKDIAKIDTEKEVAEYMSEGSGPFDTFKTDAGYTVYVRKGAFGASAACPTSEYTAMIYVEGKGIMTIQISWDYEDYNLAKEMYNSLRVY